MGVFCVEAVSRFGKRLFPSMSWLSGMDLNHDLGSFRRRCSRRLLRWLCQSLQIDAIQNPSKVNVFLQ